MKLTWHRIFGRKHSSDPRDVARVGSWDEYAEHCLTHDPELGVLTVPPVV